MTAAILTGGRARRFGGRDKSRLLVGQQTILERQLAVLRPLAEEVLIVARDAVAIEEPGLRVVTDVIPNAGALGGIYTAISAARSPQTLIVACDMPFLTLPFLRHLIGAIDGADAAIPRSPQGYQPCCAVYARRCLDVMRARIVAGSLKAIDCLEEIRIRELAPDEIVPYDRWGMLLFNINTPEDHARACALLARHGGTGRVAVA